MVNMSVVIWVGVMAINVHLRVKVQGKEKRDQENVLELVKSKKKWYYFIINEFLKYFYEL